MWRILTQRICTTEWRYKRLQCSSGGPAVGGVGLRLQTGVRRHQCPLWVTSRLHGHCVDTSALRAEADVIGGKADVEIEGLLSARERKSPSRGSNFRS